MKKINSIILKIALLFACVLAFNSCQFGKSDAPEVGTLTVYYAKEDFEAENYECKKGQLYYDSNNYDVSFKSDDDNYIFEREMDDPDGNSVESWSVPKSKIDKKTYKMYLLSAKEIGNKAVFVSDKGCTARIFWSNINGHHFCSWDGKEIKWDYTSRYNECYVLSIEINWNGNKYLFEEPLDESQGYVKLYFKPFIGQDLQVGKLEERWINKKGWDDDDNNKTAYSEDGKLLTDQWEVADLGVELSIAYLADENALYINGDLYYRQ